MTMLLDEARESFYHPFYTSHTGAICGLATVHESIRDGLAAALVARCFPLPEYEGIALEPSRRNIVPHENLILVGSSKLFVNPEAHVTRRGRPVPVQARALADRLARIAEVCCYEFIGKGPRSLRNSITGDTYVEETDETTGRLVDYGVIRRIFHGHENTIILEGFHRLGTLGVAKAATGTLTLHRIWEVVKMLPDRDDTKPLEVLVRTTFDDLMGDGIFSTDAIVVEPLYLVYDKHWIYDLRGDRRWTDQRPWTIHRVAHGDGPSRDVPAGDPVPFPRIELEADLTTLDAKTRKLAQDLLTKNLGGDVPAIPPRPNAQQKRLLRALVAQVDRFRIARVDGSAMHRRFVELPEGDTPIRIRRKEVFLHLALCRALGVSFHYNEDAIRYHFPRFETREDEGKQLTSRFVASVGSRLREGFGAVIGPRGAYAHVDNQDQTYCLRLERGALTLKLRL